MPTKRLSRPGGDGTARQNFQDATEALPVAQNHPSAQAPDSPALTEHATAIRALGSRIVSDVAEIGRRLDEVKDLVGHGNWLPWLDREFGWSADTAERFIRVHEFVEGLSDSASVRNLILTLPVSSVYLLAAPSTPEEARETIIARAQAGEPVSVAKIKETIEAARAGQRTMIGFGMHAHAERGLDLYETPEAAVRALMTAETLDGTIWEPACGPGSIVRVLRAAGHRVVATDIESYGCPDSLAGVDFLKQTSAPKGAEIILTNPPFMHADAFARHALTLVPKVIMLLRLAFLESEGRSDILDGGQLARVCVFRNRLPMMHRANWDGPKTDSGAIAFAWFIWDRDHSGPTALARISWRADAETLPPPELSTAPSPPVAHAVNDGLDIPPFFAEGRTMTAREQPAADPRRQGRVFVAFKGVESKIGTLVVAGQIWGAVEWSEKHGVWCIEDAEGQCLRHTSSIHGQAAAKEEAIALAERMVRDGTLPTPEEAADLHREAKQRERERRAKRPSEIRRAQERAEGHRLIAAWHDAYWAEQEAAPFYEIFAEAFNLADPELWKSNSFAMVRPRLLIEVRAAVADLEHQIHRQRTEYRLTNPDDEKKLARTRQILALLDGPAP